MIRGFKDKRTKAIYNEGKPQGIPEDILKRALVKLQLIHAAGSINDLRIPPGNRLEPLTGNLKGYWSIRVNDQWRIVFIWSEAGDALEVEIVDYH